MPQKNGDKMTWKNELRKAPFDVEQRQTQADIYNAKKLDNVLEREVDPVLAHKIDTGRRPYRVTLKRNIYRNMVSLVGGDEKLLLEVLGEKYNTKVFSEEPRLTSGPSHSGLEDKVFLVFEDPSSPPTRYHQRRL